MFKSYFTIAFFSTLILMLVFIDPIFSQPPPPPSPEAIPIDGGLGFLIVAGMIYGGRRIILKHKNENAS